jgi:hypothetical protein
VLIVLLDPLAGAETAVVEVRLADGTALAGRLSGEIRVEHADGVTTVDAARIRGLRLASPAPDDRASGVGIERVCARRPDYVLIGNSSDAEVDVGGYRIVKGERAYTIPDRVIIPPAGFLTVYFFEEGRHEHAMLGERLRQSGEYVCMDFDLSSGDTLVLATADGEPIDRARAR